MKGEWYDHAALVIRQKLNEARAEGLTPKETMQKVNNAYPFHPSLSWPYKAWLEARRTLCNGMPGVRPAKPKPVKGQPDVLEDAPRSADMLDEAGIELDRVKKAGKKNIKGDADGDAFARQ